jgi:hypothetical protein
VEYYDGLPSKIVAYNDYWLIVAIEAARYCESRHIDYIRYSPLKERSNEALNRLTNGEKTLGGGTFESIINSDRCKRFFKIVRVNNKRETRIYPDIPLIKAEVKARRAENFDGKIIKFTPPGSALITDQAYAVSRDTRDLAHVQKLFAKIRHYDSINDEGKVLELIGDGMSVTHANKEEPKKQ